MALPNFAQGVGQMCPATPVIRTRRLGHPYPTCWSSVPVYVGTDTRVHGYECPWVWAELFCFSALLARTWQ